jgi:hypothetical protein
MKDDDKLENLYYEMTAQTAEYIKNGYDILEVSALMIRIGLELYRTSLDEEGYDKMVDFISENRNQINPIGGNTHVH